MHRNQTMLILLLSGQGYYLPRHLPLSLRPPLSSCKPALWLCLCLLLLRAADVLGYKPAAVVATVLLCQLVQGSSAPVVREVLGVRSPFSGMDILPPGGPKRHKPNTTHSPSGTPSVYVWASYKNCISFAAVGAGTVA